MKRRRGVLAWVLTWVLVGSGRGALAQDAVAAPADRAAVVARLEAFVEELRKSQGLPGVSVALVEGPRVIWARGFGQAKPSEGVAATATTVHRVGSVSKLFTDLAVMRLVERGELDLDAPVTRELEGFHPRNPFDTSITLRQLMAHTSGLVREPPLGHYFDPTSPTLERTVASLNDTELVYRPGTRTKYSNAGVSVVGRVLEKRLGRPFPEIARREVIEPLGLTATDFEPTPAMRQAHASGLMWTYDGRAFDAPDFLLGTNAAGNLCSTALDLGKFVGVLLDGGLTPGGRLVKPETLLAMWTPQLVDGGASRTFGLGFMLGKLDGHKRAGHGGAVYGFATEVALLPDDGVGAVAIISKDCANATAIRIADGALRLLLAARAGKPLPDLETTRPLEPGRARSLAGRYGTGEAAVILEARGDRLFMTPARGGFRLELRALGKELVTDDPLGFGRKVQPGEGRITLDGQTLDRQPATRPAPPPQRWDGLIGEYGWDHNTLFIHEREGKLFALIEWFFLDPLEEVKPDEFRFPSRGLYVGESIRFVRDASGRASRAIAAGVVFERRPIDGESNATFRIRPVRPVAELRPSALMARPPAERGDFRPPELVDLTTLDPSIRLDVRYATDNNFLGTPVYTSARAFMQRPAAEALARAHRALLEQGYGLLIHDAYRPWHVTKLFWDATPMEHHGFVADPSRGSRHNRGCAVDLTLYDRATGAPIRMVGGYDEFSTRSNPDYPGGSSLQRWHRELLRSAMEAEGFTVNEVEWWHFDHRDWPKYPILNATYEELGK